MNRTVNVGKIIGLDGFCNSGKSTVLRDLCKLMLSHKGCRVLKTFQPTGDEDVKQSSIDYSGDICVLLDYCGRTILIVSGGDYIQQANVVINIIIKISIRIDVVFAGMRFKYPSVVDEYQRVFGNYGIQIKFIFKPGCKRVNEFPEGILGGIDSLWVQQLMAEL